jgi:hypothetical protein
MIPLNHVQIKFDGYSPNLQFALRVQLLCRSKPGPKNDPDLQPPLGPKADFTKDRRSPRHDFGSGRPGPALGGHQPAGRGHRVGGPYAIAIFRFNDYVAAAIPFLLVKQGTFASKKHMVGYILAFMAATLMLTFGAYTGYRTLAVATELGLS